MENREILIANTKTQKRSKLNTSATTLGELKQALQAAGIDYEGMTFTEGISKTQLLSDEAQLPHDVIYKGQPTNNLVILLTNTKKNIASGSMSRTEAYQFIKGHHLQDAVKEEFGRNYTVIPTSELASFISQSIGSADYSDSADSCTPQAATPIPCTAPNFLKSASEVIPQDTLPEIINLLINKLTHCGFLDSEDLSDISANLQLHLPCQEPAESPVTDASQPISTSDGNITDSDIDDMLCEIM